MPAVAMTKPPQAAPLKDLYQIGEIPPLGHVPAQMHAWVIRKERHGPPESSMQIEVVPTWPIGEDEVLVCVMAGGVNYNGVWALGQPISVLVTESVPHRRSSRHRLSLGRKVRRWKVGDEVIVHCNQDDGDDGGLQRRDRCSRLRASATEMFDGSFAQFCASRAADDKPHLTGRIGLLHAHLGGHIGCCTATRHTLSPATIVLV